MDPKGFYNFIDTIPKDSLFKYTSISLVVFILISRYIHQYLFTLVVTIALFVFLRDKEMTELNDTNTELYSKYTEIQDQFRQITVNSRPNASKLNKEEINQIPVYLHYDPDIINLFHNVISFSKYHPFAYQSSVISADHFLRLYTDIKAGAINCSENKELADKYASDTMNHFHSMIFKLPSDRFNDTKFQRNKKRLHLLLKRKQDEMHSICTLLRKSTPVTFRTKYDYNTGPKAINSENSLDPFEFFYL